MTLTYKDKIIKALSLANQIIEVEYIEEKLRTTDIINRRTKQGQELTEELLGLCAKRGLELTNKETPF